MSNFDTIGADILLGASLSAAATEKQTREIKKQTQEIKDRITVLNEAIREQNYLLSLNEDERKEYFRVKREREERRRREAEKKRQEEIKKRMEARVAQIRAKEENKKALKEVAISAFILIFIVAVIVGLSCLADYNSKRIGQKSTEKTQEAETIVDMTPDNIRCQNCNLMLTKCSGQYFTASGQKMNVTSKTKYAGTVYTYYSCESCHHKTRYYINKKGE